MATKTIDRTETLYMMLVDALLNALPDETAQTVRERVLSTATAEERTAVEKMAAENRKRYGKG